MTMNMIRWQINIISSKSIHNITNTRTLPPTNSENEKGKRKSVSVRRTWIQVLASIVCTRNEQQRDEQLENEIALNRIVFQTPEETNLSQNTGRETETIFHPLRSALVNACHFIHEQSSELCKARKYEKTKGWVGNLRWKLQAKSRKIVQERGHWSLFLRKRGRRRGKRREGRREEEREDIRMNQSLNHFSRYRANFVGTLICYIMKWLPRIIFVSKKKIKT